MLAVTSRLLALAISMGEMFAHQYLLFFVREARALSCSWTRTGPHSTGSPRQVWSRFNNLLVFPSGSASSSTGDVTLAADARHLSRAFGAKVSREDLSMLRLAKITWLPKWRSWRHTHTGFSLRWNDLVLNFLKKKFNHCYVENCVISFNASFLGQAMLFYIHYRKFFFKVCITSVEQNKMPCVNFSRIRFDI